MKLLGVARYFRPHQRALSSFKSPCYQPGDEIHGYQVERVAEIPEFSMQAVELHHMRTGSSHLHLARDDRNNVFNILLRTTPMNSTGVAHVLEHVALCGSLKFPVRDPFFKMLNRSMSSFMNALTGSDYTMYPFSTQHSEMINSQKTSKDFQNLLSVYLDSVFFPRIRKMDFLQEGWRLEHENVDDSSSPIVFKGVVFNEMKGMMSDPNYLYGTAIQNHLLPDHTYAVCSGGRPADIPKLTWEDLKKFHASHYHPSNAKVITYGDLPLESHLKQINEQVMMKFKKINPGTDVPPQPRWKQPRSASISSPPDSMAANPDKQATLSVNYMLPDVSDVYEGMVASVLCTLLTDGPASPFYKALIESGLGSDYSPGTGYHNHIKQAIFSVGLQGIAPVDASKIEAIIRMTMDDVIANGFSDERIESILHRIELHNKHQSSNFGIGLTFNIMPLWQHGADPLEALHVDALVGTFRKSLEEDPDYLKKKCREYFKKNTHHVTLTMVPDKKYKSKAEDIEKKNLDKYVCELSMEEKDQIFKQGKELLANQHETEDLSSLPTLKVEDIPKKQEEYVVSAGQWKLMDNPHTIVTSEQPTNGVTYFTNIIPIDELREDLKPYVPLFCDVLTQIGTNDTDYVAFSQLEDRYTGGLSASVASSTVHDPMETETYVRLTSHCLDRNVEKMFELWQELFNGANFNDSSRLRTLIRQNAQDQANGVSSRGHLFAMRTAAQYLTPGAAYDEMFSGLSQVKLMQRLVETNNISEVRDRLKEIASYVLRRHVMTHARDCNGRSMLHATRDAIQTSSFQLDQFLQAKPNRNVTPSLLSNLVDEKEIEYSIVPRDILGRPIRWLKFEHKKLSKKNIFHELPTHVNFTSMCLRTSATYVTSQSPALRIMARLLTTKYLHREIREKGGAYGGGAKHGLDGIFRFYSYRDPNNLKTIETFQKSINWFTRGLFTQQDLDEATLAVFQTIDAPVSPCNRGMGYFLDGLSNETRQLHRHRLLNITKDDVIEAATYLESVGPPGVAVIGPANQAFKDSNEWMCVS